MTLALTYKSEWNKRAVGWGAMPQLATAIERQTGSRLIISTVHAKETWPKTLPQPSRNGPSIDGTKLALLASDRLRKVFLAAVEKRRRSGSAPIQSNLPTRRANAASFRYILAFPKRPWP